MGGKSDNVEIYRQLEESNKTLTKDVENLSKETAELNEKLHAQEEGTVSSLTFMSLCYVLIMLLYKLSLFFLTEYAAQKEEIANTIKANYEKVLNTERTLKTQVKMHLLCQRVFAKGSKPRGEWWLMLSHWPTLILQAVNKLAEIMNRKDMKLDQKKKGSTADLRKKEKENRKLQLELNQEKEKFNHMAIKYQKELSEMQAVSY